MHQRKVEKYEDLHEQCIKNGRSTDIFPLGSGCWGFILNAASTFLTKLGLSPAKKREYIKKIQNKTVTASEWIWHSYRSNTILSSLVVLWDTPGVPWVSGNDTSAPKPCLNPSDEDFTGSKSVLFFFRQFLYIIFFSNFLFIDIYIYIYIYSYNPRRKSKG